MTKVGIIGATGYAGLELVRLLAVHPNVKIEAISSVSYKGKELAEIYPAMINLPLTTLVSEEEVIDQCEVIFGALPHGLSQPLAKRAINSGKSFIDLGADFRLNSEAIYTDWYGGKFEDDSLHQMKAYGLPELFRDQIKNARLIANPGCYPTGATLGLAPFVRSYEFVENSIIVDAKSGTTGAGRSPSELTHFPNCNENFAPYKIGTHRHTPEIEQNLSVISGKEISLLFTPHLLPINRGILSTMYITPKDKINLEILHLFYKNFYKDEKFIRLLPLGQTANVRNVSYSNYCDISLHYDERTHRLIVVTAIDNMVKGAAGQAIQNMNIILGFDEDAGLNLIPPSF